MKPVKLRGGDVNGLVALATQVCRPGSVHVLDVLHDAGCPCETGLVNFAHCTCPEVVVRLGPAIVSAPEVV